MQNSINTEYVTMHTLLFSCYLSLLSKIVLNWYMPQSLVLSPNTMILLEYW